MILVLVLVWPRRGSGGLCGLARVARFTGPLLESLSVPVCCGGRVCTGEVLVVQWWFQDQFNCWRDMNPVSTNVGVWCLNGV